MDSPRERKARPLVLRQLLKRGDAAHTVANVTFAGDAMVIRYDVSQFHNERPHQVDEAAFAGLTLQPFHEHLSWRIHVVSWPPKLGVRSVSDDLVEF